MSKNYRAELVGVFGDPVDGNPTGVMEEAAFAAAGLNYRYITMLVKRGELEDAVRGAKAMHMRGFNLTMPHKVDILPMLDELTRAASLIGAVNTVSIREGRLIGDNTDGRGFVQALKMAGYDCRGERITILGAGGAAKAIAVEGALAGAARITVINRNKERGEDLAETICQHTDCEAVYVPWDGSARIPADTHILIQATCVGLHPDDEALPDVCLDTIRPGMIVSDVVFNPAESAFLREAAARGAVTVSGLGMLACQGALNYQIWTGQEAPLQIMEDILRKEFSE